MTKNKKKILVAASIAGLMASASVSFAGSAFPGHDAGNRSQCDLKCCKGGANACSGKNACKGSGGACCGKNACKGQHSCGGASASADAKVEGGTLTGK